MRIGLIETAGYGGLLHYAAQLADALAGRAHDVELFIPRVNELHSYQGRARRHAVLTPTVRPDRPAPRDPFRYQLRRAGVATRLARSAARAVVECRRGRFDTVVLQWDPTLGPIAVAHRVLTAAGFGRPTIGYVLHNVRPMNRGGGSTYGGWRAVDRMRRALKSVDMVFVHGEHSLREYRSLWPPVPVTVIPHGDERILTDELAPSQEERILFFGDWRKHKGLPLLMDAFDEVVARRPSARLTIAGTPAPADFDDRIVHAWARQHGGRVELVPHYVPIGDVPDLFARARLVATPYSDAYQSGVVHLAMTAGRPVVTTDVGDLASVVTQGATGLVVPRGDRHALVDALVGLLSDAELAATMGRAARRRVDATSTWDSVAALVEEALVAQMPFPGRRG